MRDGVLDVLLRQVRVDAGRFGRVEFGAPWGARVGPRDAASLHHVLAGGFWLDVAGRREHVTAGELVVLPHGAAHELRHHPDAPVTTFGDKPPSEAFAVRGAHGGAGERTVLLCAESTVTGAARSLLLRALPPVVRLDTAEPGVRRLLDGIRDEVRGDRPGAPHLAARFVELLLLHGIRAELERPAGTSWRAALHDERVGRALEALYRDPAAPWTVATLARAAGMSRTTFAHRFRALVGESPVAHLTSWRMDLARTALRTDPTRSVASIATSVGYVSEFAFSTAFRRATGLPPGRYRYLHARG
ncbi:AraC family transcriptional regulator [Actinosynnema sp. NPDC020468]|uniref:AraC family transcriptional regulator n=1 Tax=Actinosynnema sp. NPDC020468 TaxID=3154488 RepID=UPI0033F94A17